MSLYQEAWEMLESGMRKLQNPNSMHLPLTPDLILELMDGYLTSSRQKMKEHQKDMEEGYKEMDECYKKLNKQLGEE